MSSTSLLAAVMLAITLSGPTLAEPQYSSQVDGLELVVLQTLRTFMTRTCFATPTPVQKRPQ
ncbi:MAG: hypothetical protein ACRC6I_21735, partial [Paracoccaceae bacterium]